MSLSSQFSTEQQQLADNNRALSDFLTSAYKEIETRINKETAGEKIDPRMSMQLPHAMNPYHMSRLSAHDALRSYCASPANDYALILTAKKNSAGEIVATTVTIDMDFPFRASRIDTLSPGGNPPPAFTL